MGTWYHSTVVPVVRLQAVRIVCQGDGLLHVRPLGALAGVTRGASDMDVLHSCAMCCCIQLWQSNVNNSSKLLLFWQLPAYCECGAAVLCQVRAREEPGWLAGWHWLWSSHAVQHLCVLSQWLCVEQCDYK
jgi:hypothetical protein